MITLYNVQTAQGFVKELSLDSPLEKAIDAKGLLLLPGVIDPHVHFRTPGLEHKENWIHAAKAALCGGITMVFDMPNTLPPTTSSLALNQKKQIIQEQLEKASIPLRYGLYLGADKNCFQEIENCKQEIIGIKVFMGSTTGGLVMNDDSSLHAIFSLAAAHDLIISVHAEDEHLILSRQKDYDHLTSYETHSKLRSEEVATRATEKAIALARLYGTRLNILHVSTKDEIPLIQNAKKEGLSVTAETTPHHLFLSDALYGSLRGYAQVNPPLRSSDHGKALLNALRDGIIDMIGSDHAPHTKIEKEQPYGICPSGFPGIDTLLPLLLEAHHQGLLSLSRIEEITHKKIREIFKLPFLNDYVLVDLQKQQTVHASRLLTKCGWSPYEGLVLRGWPIMTILGGQIYDISKISGAHNASEL